MVVCKFFLQGNCRYGNSCWNDHPSGESQGYSMTAQRQLFGGGKKGGGGPKVSFRDSFGQNQNPYRWISSDAQQQQQQQQQGRTGPTSTQQISPAEIVKGLALEVETWEGSKMWPFTCLGIEKEMPSLPDFNDISPEEMRFDAYEALKSGTIQSYIQKVEAAFNQVNTQRQDLKNPNMSFKQKLISFIDDCKRKKSSGSNGHVSLFSDSGSGGFGSGNSGGLFGSSSSGVLSRQPSTGLFGQPSTFGETGTQSPFGQTGSQSPFGQTGSQSLFGQAGTQSVSGTQETGFGQTGSLFGQGAFGAQPGNTGQAQAGQTGLFGQAATGFGQGQPQTSNPTTLFGKPVDSTQFGSQPSSASGSVFQSSSPFGQPTDADKSPFARSVTVVPPTAVAGTSSVQASQSGETTIYTPVNKLTADELEQFKAPIFSLGFIPTKPPPRELCF